MSKRNILTTLVVIGLFFSAWLPVKAQEYVWPGEEIKVDVLPLEEGGPDYIFIRYTGFGQRPADLASFMSSEPIQIPDFVDDCTFDGSQKVNCKVTKNPINGLYLSGVFVPLSPEGNVIYVQLTWLDGGMLERPFNIGPEATPEPTEEATAEPTAEPTEEATAEPTAEPTEECTPEATTEPTEEATAEPTEEVTPEPTDEPTPEPTDEATPEPTDEATPEPTDEATSVPTQVWTPAPVETPDQEVVETPQPVVTTPEVTEEPTTEIPVETPAVVVTVGPVITQTPPAETPEPVETPQAPTNGEVVAQPSPLVKTFVPQLSR